MNSARTLGWNPFSDPFFHPNPSLGKFAFLRQASLQEGQAGRLRRALLGQQDHGTAPRLLEIEQNKMAIHSFPMDPWRLSERVQLTPYIHHTPVVLGRHGRIHRDYTVILTIDQ